MKMKLSLGLSILALAVLGAACGSTTTTTTNTTTTTTTNTGSGGQAVMIKDNFYSPSALTVSVGTTVTWTNDGNSAHTVNWDGDIPDSGQLLNGQTYSHTFDTAGTFAYQCGNHGVSMAGSVTVTP